MPTAHWSGGPRPSLGRDGMTLPYLVLAWLSGIYLRSASHTARRRPMAGAGTVAEARGTGAKMGRNCRLDTDGGLRYTCFQARRAPPQPDPCTM